MQIYLPIAEQSIDVLLLLGVGGLVGVVSGLFGVGGGFLATPILIFLGISPAVAVATGATQVVASSVSGAVTQWRANHVDLKMGVVMLVGGFSGSSAGVIAFGILSRLGQIDLVITLSIVGFLGVTGALMLVESGLSLFRARRPGGSPIGRLHTHTWIHNLPFKMKFRRSKLYISAFVPLAVGVFSGILSAIMGVGGGFIMVPAMIYLIGMPTVVAVGTSLFEVVFIAANVSFLQAVNNHTVDLVLALVLITGGVVGAQIGSRLGSRLRGAELRGLLAILVIAVAGKLLFDLVVPPDDLYSLAPAVQR
jgi:uncharacterized membrane protein YfcA